MLESVSNHSTSYCSLSMLSLATNRCIYINGGRVEEERKTWGGEGERGKTMMHKIASHRDNICKPRSYVVYRWSLWSCVVPISHSIEILFSSRVSLFHQRSYRSIREALSTTQSFNVFGNLISGDCEMCSSFPKHTTETCLMFHRIFSRCLPRLEPCISTLLTY